MQDVPIEKVNLEIPEKNNLILEYFEIELLKASLSSDKERDFMKAAMMSWSYIEEYFLPTQIKFVAKNQNIKLEADFLKNKSAYHLIRYYFMISYDREMYDLLEKARKLRNKMTHNIYSTKSIQTIHECAQESSDFNLGLVIPMLDREEGRVVAPALLIAVNARNELRREQRKRLNKTFDRSS